MIDVTTNARASLGRNLTHGLLDILGRAIVTGHYDGRRFPTEAELAIHHNVSRSVTRESVKMLTAKGLLSSRPRQGTIVEPLTSWNMFDTDVLDWLLDRKFSVELLIHFNELRIAIEPMAARLAAQRADPAELLRIVNGFGRMVAAEQGEDDHLESDIAFHVAILLASGNPFYRQFQDLVRTALRTSIRFTNRYKGRPASVPAHRDVLNAIQAGDVDGAGRAMQAIIDDVMTLIAESTSANAR